MAEAAVDDDAPERAAFRAETRAWLQANRLPEMRRPMSGAADLHRRGRHLRFTSPDQMKRPRVLHAPWSDAPVHPDAIASHTVD
jgi:hypothetical protein